MKIVVVAHNMEVGGTQVNAIELSAGLRDTYGHDVVLFGTPGPMVKVAEEKGMRFISAPHRRRIHEDSGDRNDYKPSPAMMRALREVVRSERPDLVHTWEAWQCVDAYYAVHLMERVPMIASDMNGGNSLLRFLPKTILTTFGTPELVDRARAAGRRRVELLVPPVDVHANAPGIVDP